MLPGLSLKDLAGVFLAIALLIITYFKLAFTYWKRRNVPQLEPSIPFGDAQNPFRIKQPFFLTVKGYYDAFRSQGHRHGGIYMSTKPVYMPIDPDYVKSIMATDFRHFFDRGTYYNEKADPLSGHLFNLEGQKWRSLRAKLTPTFTSGKMKMMFQTLLDCGEQMMEALDGLAAEAAVDVKEVLGCYSTDVIGSCAFGLDCNSFATPDAEFRRNGRNIFRPTFKRKMRVFFATTFPGVCKLLGVVFIPKDVSSFFLDVVRKMIEHRERNKLRRNDFMQLLLDLKDGEGGKEGLTVEQMAAQAFVFFIAGFETSATTMNFCLFELAQDRQVQDGVRDEILRALDKYGGRITYDAIADLKYLDQVVNETLRKYPPVPHLSRKCTSDYRIPGTDIVLEKNRKVFISILGLHRDPEYYPDPEVFDPERFSDENKEARHPFTFLPFGEGPRNCIGARFGMMQTKVGLTLILRRYRIALSPRTELPLVLEPTALLMSTRNKVWLDMEKVSC